MSLLDEGYTTEEEYLDYYVIELSPLMLNFNLTLAGVDVGLADRVGVEEGFSYLELGFGRGTSLNIHAACFDGHFVGTDFNSAHALEAIKNAVNSNVKHYEDSFSELLARFADEKPQFDYIVFHGVFSWVPKSVRDSIMEIVRKYLKTGGVVYSSYNCYPGWAPKAPSRHLFSLFNQHASGNLNDRVNKMIHFFEEFLKTESLYTKTMPQNAQLLNDMKKFIPSKISYIAHEYLNDTWDILYFTDMLSYMKTAKCGFVCTAKTLEHYEDLHVSPEGIAFLNTIKDEVFREQLKDYYMCRQFRADIYTRAHTALARHEGIEKILNTEFILTKSLENFQNTISTSRGEAKLTPEIYEKILESLDKNDAQAKTAREIVETTQLPFDQVLNAICILISQNMVLPTQKITKTIRKQCNNFNHALFDRQSKKASSLYVASPLTGTAIMIGETEQIMLKAVGENLRSVTDLAKYVWNAYKPQGRRHIKDGKVVESDDENIAEAERIADIFLKSRLPIYKRLGIC